MSVFIDGFEIDVAVQEDHVFPGTITSDPVEESSPTSDNIRDLPNEVTLTGIVSDTPIGALASRRPDLEENDTYSALAYDFLLSVRANKLPVTIETSLGIYENMGLESLSIPRAADTGAALQFTAKFTQLRIVRNERATVRVELPRARKKKDKGAQQPVDATPPDKAKTKAKYESALSEWTR